MPKILREEPGPSSQTCGYQMQIGSWHNDGNRYGVIRMAPGNAIGTG